MCAARRTTSTRLTRLAVKASPYHNAVTLYEAGDPDSAGPSNLRRPSRVKQEPTDPETPGLDVSSDTKQGRTISKRQKHAKTDVPDSDVSRKSPKKPTSKPKGLDVPQPDVSQPGPARWEDAYAAIKEMRSRVVAPVDTMGCDQAQLKERDPGVGLDVLSPLHPSSYRPLSSSAFFCTFVPLRLSGLSMA